MVVETERLFLREMNSVISKEGWLREIGAKVINQQREGVQDGI